MGRCNIWCAVFLVSALVVGLQLALTRMLSVIYWPDIVYAGMTLSLMGSAISAGLLTGWKRLRAWDDATLLFAGVAGLALSTGISTWLLIGLNSDALTFGKNFGALTGLKILLMSLIAMVPSICAGGFLLTVFGKTTNRSGTLYFCTLLGSAVGCLGYGFLIEPLGAERFLRLFIFAPAVLLAIYLFPASQLKFRFAWAASAILVFLLVTFACKIEPGHHKQYWTWIKGEHHVEFSEWNAFSRVDVISQSSEATKRILVDGNAQVPILPSRDSVLVESSVINKNIIKPNPLESAATIALNFIPDKMGLSPLPLIALAKKANCHLEQPDAKTGWALFCFDQKVTAVTQGDISHHLAVSVDLIAKRITVSGDYRPLAIFTMGAAAPEIFNQTEFTINPKVLAPVRYWHRALRYDELEALGGETDSARRELAFKLLNRPQLDKVLIIGAGGGADILSAHYHGAHQIVATESNPTIYQLLTKKYAANLSPLVKSDQLTIHFGDGRSFVRRDHTNYDALIIFDMDHFNGLQENYLYTREAFADFWDRLSSDGILQLSRPFNAKSPHESLRAFIMAYEMLKSRGFENPDRYLVMVKDPGEESTFATLLLSKSPFDSNAIQRFEAWLIARGYTYLFNPTKPVDSPGTVFNQFVQAEKNHGTENFFRRDAFNVTPVSDDSPFFFQTAKGPLAVPIIPGCLAAILALSSLLIWFQWRALKQIGHEQKSRTFGYFAMLGLASIFVGIFFVQKLHLLLGDPTYSLVVTIPSLLAAAGLGSLLCERWQFEARGQHLVLLSLPFVLLSMKFLLPMLVNGLLPLDLPLRILCTTLFLLPLGMLIGMPFPLGLKQLKSDSLVGLAWTAQATAAVLASVLGFFIATQSGFTVILVLAAGLYAGAFLAGYVFSTSRSFGILRFGREKAFPKTV